MAVIVAVTLRPAATPGGAVEDLLRTCLLCGGRGTSDAVLNILMFAPLGAALVGSGWRIRTVVFASLLLSIGIEVLQIGLAGRYAVLGDVVWNTIGGMLGAVAAARAATFGTRVAKHPGVLGALLVLLPVAVAGATAWLLVPAPQQGTYYGQWTADLGPSLGVYRGEVLEAEIGRQPAPSWKLSDSEAARSDLISGEPLTVRFLAGPPPDRLAPIFSIYDGVQHEVLLVGAESDDLVLRIRRRAADYRLDQPDIRWTGALRELLPGDTATLAIRRVGAVTFCAQVQDRERCQGTGAGYGWALLLYPGDSSARLRTGLHVTWGFLGIASVVAGLLLMARAAAGATPPPRARSVG